MLRIRFHTNSDWETTKCALGGLAPPHDSSPGGTGISSSVALSGRTSARTFLSSPFFNSCRGWLSSCVQRTRVRHLRAHRELSVAPVDSRPPQSVRIETMGWEIIVFLPLVFGVRPTLVFLAQASSSSCPLLSQSQASSSSLTSIYNCRAKMGAKLLND